MKPIWNTLLIGLVIATPLTIVGIGALSKPRTLRLDTERGPLRATRVLLLSPACSVVTLEDGSEVIVQGDIEVRAEDRP